MDFCIPCNPYFPSPEMFSFLSRNLESVLKFHPSDSGAIAGQLSSALGLNPATVAMSNGSTELITWIDHLWVHESIAIPIPAFGRWTDQFPGTGKRVDMFLLPERDGFEPDLDAYVHFIRSRGSRVAVLCNPNNPDGGYLPRREVVRFLDELSDLDLVIVDESFIDFILVKLPGDITGAGMRDYLLLKHQVRAGVLQQLGLSGQYLRLVVRPEADVERLVSGMRAFSQTWCEVDRPTLVS